VAWALGHGAVALGVHASLGLALVVVTFVVAVRAVRRGPRSVSVAYVLGFLFVVGAGFNGASFLDFAGQSISSLIMTLLALAGLCCYLVGLYLLPARRPTGD
jgi:membrane-associated PAP2 superfamily phosphatase